LGAVLVVGDVAYVVCAVFDAPVAADVGRDVGGIGLVGGQAGDAVDGLGGAVQAADDVPAALDAPGLVDTGEVEVRNVAGDGDGADLIAAVGAVKRCVVRGERTLRRGP
jgi:hypothetical protein